MRREGEGHEVRRRWPGLHPVPVPAGSQSCAGASPSPHTVFRRRGAGGRGGEAARHGPGHWAEVRRRSGDSLFIEQRPGSRQPTPGTSPNLRPQSDALSVVPPASRGPRVWTRLGSREAATETWTHTGRTSRGDRGGGALSTYRSRRSAALTPRWRFGPPTARKDSLCPKPRATSTPRVQATLSRRKGNLFSNKDCRHTRASRPGGISQRGRPRPPAFTHLTVSAQGAALRG